jgi:RNA polymerase sigma factor FliA
VASYQNDPKNIEALWEEYKSNPTPNILQSLMVAYLPLVKKIAFGFLRKKPALLDYEDLIQAGNMGLMNAITRFDDTKGASFKTYATIRVRGAIIDEINSLDWTPRSVRKNIKSVINAIEKHNQEYGHSEPFSSNRMPDESPLSPEELSTVLSQMNRTYMVNLEPELMRETLSIHDSFEKEEKAIIINEVIHKALSEEEATYIKLKFFYEQDNKTIASTLNITISRLNNIRKEALIKLSEALKDYKN